MERKAKQDVESGWESSTRGDRAWKEATARVEERNAAARKVGRQEREAQERERADARRARAANRQAKLLKRPTP